MQNKIRQLVKQAMIDKNENAKTTYKSILDNALKIAKNDGNREVTNDDFIKAAKNEVKQLNDLYEYVKTDAIRAAEVEEKLKYCEAILPQMVTAEQITEYLTSILTNEYTGNYAPFVVISKLFMKSNNYLLNAYFMNDISGLKKFYDEVEERQSLITKNDFIFSPSAILILSDDISLTIVIREISASIFAFATVFN